MTYTKVEGECNRWLRQHTNNPNSEQKSTIKAQVITFKVYSDKTTHYLSLDILLSDIITSGQCSKRWDPAKLQIVANSI